MLDEFRVSLVNGAIICHQEVKTSVRFVSGVFFFF